MQDEIVAHLANRLGQELARAEARRAERSATPDSIDHYFLGLALWNKGVTAEFLDKARFDRALDLDPANVDALVERAWIDVIFAANYLSNDRAERHRIAESDLGKALRLRPDNASAHCALGVSRMYSNRAAQGIAVTHQPARHSCKWLDVLRRMQPNQRKRSVWLNRSIELHRNLAVAAPLARRCPRAT